MSQESNIHNLQNLQNIGDYYGNIPYLQDQRNIIRTVCGFLDMSKSKNDNGMNYTNSLANTVNTILQHDQQQQYSRKYEQLQQVQEVPQNMTTHTINMGNSQPVTYNDAVRFTYENGGRQWQMAVPGHSNSPPKMQSPPTMVPSRSWNAMVPAPALQNTTPTFVKQQPPLTPQPRTFHLSDTPNPRGGSQQKHEKKYECPECGDKFTRNHVMQSHIKVVHYREKAYVCPICFERFGGRSTMKNHILTHTQEKPYKCLQCDYGCNQKGTLLVHVRRHHTKEKPFACNKCHKKFTTKYSLNKHMVTHSDAELINCTLCDYKCRDTKAFQVHIRLHSEKPFRCTFCPRRFSDAEIFKQHQTAHSQRSIRDFKCKLCTYSTKHKHSVAVHMRAHHPGEMPFVCQYCDDRFLLASQLKRHLLVHTGDKVFKCSHCKFVGSRRHYLRQHLLKMHVNRDGMKCGLCEVKFESEGEIRKHMMVHLGRKILTCKTCNYKCFYKNALKTHACKKQRYKCDLCNKNFHGRRVLDKHMKTHQKQEPEDPEPEELKEIENIGGEENLDKLGYGDIPTSIPKDAFKAHHQLNETELKEEVPEFPIVSQDIPIIPQDMTITTHQGPILAQEMTIPTYTNAQNIIYHTQSMPTNLTQTMPANLTQSMPANLTHSMPANLIQSMPANLTRHMQHPQ
ncbi:unnamed protein product [Meganyctiphanes norvegica]|uniref:C2H2-type domain-containing protein n=1 Tax=Meganyctiphanes norvegica TaxID=48144 RepID=A0AAV2RD73_MEGNR